MLRDNNSFSKDFQFVVSGNFLAAGLNNFSGSVANAADVFLIFFQSRDT